MPFLTILNLYQSFWEKLSEKNLECHFLPFQIYTSSFLGKIVRKIWNAIFGHSEFIPVFLEKIVRKNLEYHFWPFWIYTSLFVKNCQKKFGTTIFGHSEFIPVFLGKIVRKKLEWPFLAIPNLYQSFWPFWEKLSEKIQKKLRMAIFGHSKFIPVFWEKLSEKFEKTSFLEKLPFLAIPVFLSGKNLYQSFGKNCQKN